MLKRWLVAGRWLAAVALASLVLLAPVQAEVAIPVLKSRVTDLTGTLTAEQKTSLEQRLAAFESAKGSQMAVLMLPTTKPEEIEQFSIRLAEAWKIGRKGTDDGLILVVAKDDRRLRVEVGYGLEGAIPDATAKRVISETITPKFKAGEFYGGISAGVDQLIKLAEGEKLPPPSATPASQSSSSSKDPFEYLVPSFFVLLIGGAAVRAMFGRVPGAVISAVIMGVVAWFLFSVGIAAIVAIIAFIMTLLNTGNWTSGSGGSGGFSSGSSSGGSSWGGGGGSFGGGGSSGSW